VLVERGFRVVPLGFNRIWGDVFVDAGSAWCPGECGELIERIPSKPEPLVSAGVEAILDIRIGYIVDQPIRFGVAVPLTETEAGRPQAYVRFERLF
jgi:hypothetical protein